MRIMDGKLTTCMLRACMLLRFVIQQNNIYYLGKLNFDVAWTECTFDILLLLESHKFYYSNSLLYC